MKRTTLICQLPKQDQEKIYNRLLQALGEQGIDKQEVDLAMNNRICDIEELLSFEVIQELLKDC